jgi:ABC-type glycerol-3-phosphate transport system substrate-binding protein
VTRRGWGAQSARLAAGLPLAAGLAAGGCAGPEQRPSAASAPPASLEMWHINGPGPVADALQALTGDYSTAHPGITFTLTLIGGGAGRLDKLAAAVVGGTAPDVVQETGAPEQGTAGYLTPLNDYVKRDKSFNQPEIFDGPWRRCTFFDQVWAVPVICDDRGLYFNKALFREAGLDPDKPPKTWDELEQAAVKLTRKTGSGYDRIGFIPLYGNVEIYSYILMNGGEIERFSGKDKVELLFNNTTAVQAADAIVRLYDRAGGFDAVAAYQSTLGGMRTAQNPFWLGQLGMMRHGSWMTGDARKYGVTLDYGMAPEPVGPSGKGPATLTGGWNWTLAKNAPHADQGWGFLSWFTQAAQSVRFATPQGNMPARKSALNADYVQKNPDIKFFFEALGYSRPFPEDPWGAVMWDAVTVKAQTAIVTRQQSAKAALDEAARVVQAEVDKWFAAHKS